MFFFIPCHILRGGYRNGVRRTLYPLHISSTAGGIVKINVHKFYQYQENMQSSEGHTLIELCA